MPANSTGTIAIGVDVDALASYDYSKQDSIAYLSRIPVNGTELTLPMADAVGEFYEFVDVDGTCSVTHPITVVAQGGQQIRGAGSLIFSEAFVYGRLEWTGKLWAVETNGAGGEAAAPAQGFQHQPNNTILLVVAPTILAQVAVTPATSGIFRLIGNAAITNADGAAAHVATLAVNHTTNGNTCNRTVPAAAVDEQMGIVAISDAQPLGVPVTFELLGSDAAASAELSSIGGLAATWLTVEEFTPVA